MYYRKEPLDVIKKRGLKIIDTNIKRKLFSYLNRKPTIKEVYKVQAKLNRVIAPSEGQSLEQIERKLEWVHCVNANVLMD